MTFFTSEYESKLDAKGRLLLPSRIKAQLPEGTNQLVLRRGYEPCLIIYPLVEFKKVFAKISALSESNPDNRVFQRSVLSGLTEIEMDINGRILIPKNMLAYAQLEKDVILTGIGNRVEMWNPALYEKHLISDPSELSKLEQKYLGE
jgi:MraZ protein